MRTQTIEQKEVEVTTYPFFIPDEYYDYEYKSSSVLPKCFALMGQNLASLPQIGSHDYYRGVIKKSDNGLANELLTWFFSFTNRDIPSQTETFVDEDQERLSVQSVSGITVSQEIAEEIRSNKVSAFVPVSATDLIWLEAFSMDDNADE